ncbi:unnamed protein product [Phytomonas sp. EM1]|nr:unnamed protein product [Phytomonas sp. EM1]|eukprot:CCW63372.1 unnamed protein product [Phytomonas sp. isolate EM1]
MSNECSFVLTTGPVHSWVTDALTYFADDVQELQMLQSERQEMDATALQAATREASSEVESIVARQRQTSPSSGHTPTRKSTKTRQNITRGNSTLSQTKPDSRSNLECKRLVAERVRAFEASRASQPFRRQLAQYQSLLQETQRKFGPIRAKEESEYNFFVSRPEEFYTMDDVVATNERAAAANASSEHTDFIDPSEDAVDSNTTGTVSVSPLGTVNLCPWIDSDSVVIDAGRFAQEYNETLTREYGYKPILGGRRAFSTPVEDDFKTKKDREQAKTDSQRALLSTHRPGIYDPLPDIFPPQSSWQSTSGPQHHGAVKAIEQASTAADRMTFAGSNTASHSEDAGRRVGHTAVVSSDPRKIYSATAMDVSLSLPSLLHRDDTGNGASKRQEVYTLGTTSDGSAKGTKSTAPKSQSKSGKTRSNTQINNGVSVKERRGDLPMGIECSATNREVTLQTVTGQPTSIVIRFTNRNKQRMRFRVKPSTHAWLHYACVHVAPVAGGSNNTRHGASVKESYSGSNGCPESLADGIFLGCGGYIEVKVVFTPMDTFTPKLETTLSIGITRELNSLSMEGAQWKFFEVAVNCETLLPVFQLFHLPHQPEEDGLLVRSQNPKQVTIAELSESDRLCCTGRNKRTETDLPGEIPFTAGSPPWQKANNLNGPLPEAITNDTSSLVARLLPSLATPVSLEECVFPPTFVLSSFTQRYFLVNVGSSAVVNLTCSSEAYTIHPSGPFALGHAGGIEISITFRPMEWRDPFDERLVVAIRNAPACDPKSRGAGLILDDGRGAVLAQQYFSLHGTSVVPRVALQQIGDMALPPNAPTISSVEMTGLEDSDGETAPRYFIPDTCPEVCSTLSVCVHNSCALPLPYRWVLEVCGGIEGTAEGPSDAEGISNPDAVRSIATIQPSRGTMAAMEESVFTVSVSPSVAGKLTISCSLFLEGLPDPEQIPEAELAQVPSWIVALYNRHGQIPPASSASESGRLPGEAEGPVDGAFAAADMGCALTDPFALFQARTLSKPGHLRDLVFSTGFYLFAFPTDPSLRMISGVLDATIELLTGLEVSRCVTLQNPSPRALHFLWNTPEIPHKDSQVETVRMSISGMFEEPLQRAKDPISTWCQPREGCIPAHGQQDIAVSFIAHMPGMHSKTLECSVPELHSRYELVLKVRGVGPTVHTSTQFLEFGIIKVGTKHASTFTVSNTNPVPVLCSFQDPIPCDPSRFMFPKAPIHIAANDSAKVTVYRNAVAFDIPEAFFEVVVHGGASIAIETHAIVQNPQIVLDDPVVDFGFDVPEGVWQERALYLSNNSNFDISFAMKAASTQSPWVRLEHASSLVLRAGEAHMEVPIRACFLHNPQEKESSDGYCVDLEIHSQQTQQVLLVKVCATTIEQLSVSVDVVTAAKAQGELCNGVNEPSNVSSFGMPIEKYVSVLLLNALEMVLDTEHLPKVECPCVQVVGRTTLDRGAGAHLQCPTDYPSVERGVVVRPFCEDVQLRTELPHHSPVCSETLMVQFRNYSKCTTRGVLWVGESYSILSGFDRTKRTRAINSAATENPLGENDNFIEVASSTAQGFKGSPKSHGTRTSCSRSLRLMNKRASIPAHPAERVSITANEWLQATQLGFWTTERNGVAARRRAEQAALAGAQHLLLDGNGCRMALPPSTAVGIPIGPLESIALPVSLHANLPGRYTKTLLVECEGLPRTAIGLDWEVVGHPLLLDPTTAGLTKDENGHEVLLMTPVVASLGSSHRVLRVINRLPREVCTSVEVHLSTSSFSVVAVEEEVEASRVVLRLGTVPEAVRQSGAARYGAARVTPSVFLMPALSTREIHVEYTPSAKLVEPLMPRASLDKDGSRSFDDPQRGCRSPARRERGRRRTGSHDDFADDDGDRFSLMRSSQEVDWNGCLVINCKLAESPFNDMFLIDEFYEQNQAIYPSKRVLRRYSATAEKEESGASRTNPKLLRRTLQKKDLDLEETTTVLPTSLRLVPILQLFQPLRTRPGKVVRSGKLVEPSTKEKHLLEGCRHIHHESLSRQSFSLNSSCVHSALSENPIGEDVSESNNANSDEDSEVDDWPGSSENARLLEATGSYSTRSLPVLAEDRERRELLAYLKCRRSQLTEESVRYFKPIELRLRARCGVPRLILDPPVAQVEFQPYHNDGKPILRTVRVVNPNTAALRFSFQLFTRRGSREAGVVGATSEEVSESCGSFTVVAAARLRGEEEAAAATSPVAATVGRNQAGNPPLRATHVAKAKAMAKAATSTIGPSIPSSTLSRKGREPNGRRAHAAGAIVPAGNPALTPAIHASAPAKIIHELRSFESLDVTVAYLPPARPFSLSPTTALRDVWGCVRVEFIPSEAADNTSGGGTSSSSQNSSGWVGSSVLERAPVQEILLHVPLVVPKLSCDLSLLCFRPGNIILDGREQPSYSQCFTLYNHASMAVEYEIALVDTESSNAIAFSSRKGYHASDWDGNRAMTSSDRGLTNSSDAISRASRVGEKIDALFNMPPSPMPLSAGAGFGSATSASPVTIADVDNTTVPRYLASGSASVVRGKEAAEHFVLAPRKGWVPAATAGGQPGASVIEVVFNAYSNVVYECTYTVIANQEPSELFIKLMGISRDTEL